MKVKIGDILVFKYVDRDERLYSKVVKIHRNRLRYEVKVIRDEDSEMDKWEVGYIHHFYSLENVEVYDNLKNAIIMESL